MNRPAIHRLGIPEYNWWNECLHGVARAGEATVFPQAIGLAATWDRDMMRQVSDVISDEARAKHSDFVARGNAVSTRDLPSGRPTSIFSGIPAGAGAWKPMVKTLTLPVRWRFSLLKDCRVMTQNTLSL